MSKLTDKRVHSFEAVDEHGELFKKTILYNQLHNVVVEKKALTDYTGEIAFFKSDEMDEGSILKKETNRDREILVSCTTVDDYAEKNAIEVGLIKVDIEGAEQSLIKGALKTIKKCRPTLLISIYHSAEDFFDIKPMLEDLDLNYVFKVYRPPMMNILTDTVLIAECKDHMEAFGPQE